MLFVYPSVLIAQKSGLLQPPFLSFYFLFLFIRSLFHQFVLHLSEQKRCVRLAPLGRYFPHISHFLRSPSRFRLDMNIFTHPRLSPSSSAISLYRFPSALSLIFSVSADLSISFPPLFPFGDILS